ncbi:MAG: nonstructural protein [Microviridae sp.]|nr:MAG: nonstructural protein [Microviridae sp.]
MKLSMFSVYDKAVQAWLPPFFARAKGEALRNFSAACNDKEHLFFKHIGDYYLAFLGEWDDSTGLFDAIEPVRLVSAQECLVDDSEVFTEANKFPKRLPM